MSKQKPKARYVRRKLPVLDPLPSDFTYMRKLLFQLFIKVPTVGSWLAKLYVKMWNPINYAIIGGIGVLINYAVLAATIGFVPWFIGNFFAILIAWVWNWTQAVGHFSYLWGFRRKDSAD